MEAKKMAESEAEQALGKCLDGLSGPERCAFLDRFLRLCSSHDLLYLSSRLDEYKRDFVSLLPNEVVDKILGYLDWKDLLNCCQVCSIWNERISHGYNRFWYTACRDLLPVNSDEFARENPEINYKSAFVDIVRRSGALESGQLFHKWDLAPLEINALASYKNIIATATHLVKFWTISGEKEWRIFKTFQLQSRASAMKFDDRFLVVNTYFFSLDLYSLDNDQFVFSFMGHTCSISCFDFNSSLMMIATGSADNTIKYWSMDVSNLLKRRKFDIGGNFSIESSQLLIGTEPNTIWPVKVSIQKYSEASESLYLVIALCTNGFIFITDVEKVDDFVDEEVLQAGTKIVVNHALSDDVVRFSFKFGLKLSSRIRDFLDAQSKEDDFLLVRMANISNNDDFDDFDEAAENSTNHQDTNTNYLMSNKSYIDFKDGVLTAHIVTDNNNYQTTKLYLKRWSLVFMKRLKSTRKLVECERENSETAAAVADEDVLAYMYRFRPSDFDNSVFDYLNQKTLSTTSMDISHFEIVSFGTKYCLFVDEHNRFYLTNIKTRSVRCLNEPLKLNNKIEKVFRLISSNTQEQFIYGDRDWFNGFKLNDCPEDGGFVLAFYTQQRYEVVILTWQDLQPQLQPPPRS